MQHNSPQYFLFPQTFTLAAAKKFKLLMHLDQINNTKFFTLIEKDKRDFPNSR